MIIINSTVLDLSYLVLSRSGPSSHSARLAAVDHPTGAGDRLLGREDDSVHIVDLPAALPLAIVFIRLPVMARLTLHRPSS